MSYSIALSIVNGQPVITNFSGDLPSGAVFSISGHEPIQSYARRSVGLSVYGQDSILLASAGAAVDLPPAAPVAVLALAPDPEPGDQAAQAAEAGAAVSAGPAAGTDPGPGL